MKLDAALRSVLLQRPALRGSSASAIKSAAQMLEGPAASMVGQASLETLDHARRSLKLDVFAPAPVLATQGPTPKPKAPTAVVSGGSYSGLASAIALAKLGFQVKVIEARPDHLRDIRLSAREGMLDALASVEPRLAEAVAAIGAPLSPQNMSSVLVQPDGTRTERPMAGAVTARRAPDGALAPADGASLMASPFTHVQVAREMEAVIEAFVREHYPSIELLTGKLEVQRSADETQLRLANVRADGTSERRDFLNGVTPALLIVAEGSSSSTRAALSIDTAVTTPAQTWIAGVVGMRDPKAPEGQASMRALVRTQQTDEGPVTTRAVALSDGDDSTWLLTQLPAAHELPRDALQATINEAYVEGGALLTQTKPSTLLEAGLKGPIDRPGSVPTVFTLQGKTAKDAAMVLPGGLVVGLVGDAVINSTFQAGGGMNTAISQLTAVTALATELLQGHPPAQAAERFERAVFERGDAWSAAGISFFYDWKPPQERQLMVEAHLEALAAWRREGGASPHARLESVLEQASVAQPPIGLSLAA